MNSAFTLTTREAYVRTQSVQFFSSSLLGEYAGDRWSHYQIARQAGPTDVGSDAIRYAASAWLRYRDVGR